MTNNLKESLKIAGEVFVGVGDWDKDAQDYGEILTAVVRLTKHPAYK